jgi:hypothetical protein
MGLGAGAGPGAGLGAGPQSQAEAAAQASGHVIKQRDSAVPDQRRIGAAAPIAAIAPDGLESFARDLRALRAKAELDYPEMAERSHYTMKTLASAAGGLRLPTLPVAIAYVRACGGDTAEWEDRWHKLAEKITAEAAKKQQADGDGESAPEPGDTPELPGAQVPEPPASPPPSGGNGEVYVITSAKPRQPGW